MKNFFNKDIMRKKNWIKDNYNVVSFTPNGEKNVGFILKTTLL